MTIIVRTISRLLFPFMSLFGIYIVIHGHLTPGGGFPGGVIIAAAVLMLVLAYGAEKALTGVKFPHVKVLESTGGLLIATVGLLGLIIGTTFLQNVFPLGELIQLVSAEELLLLYICVGIKVTAGILLIFYAMLLTFRGEEE